MFGKNSILPPTKSNGAKLSVHKIFATFQGEGMFTGFPAIFIRLSGCNLACKFCDTEFDSGEDINLNDLITQVLNLANHDNKRIYNLIVITGGEPLRQNIIPLCKKLLSKKFQVQIETNGTLFQDLPKEVSIICSPKNNTTGYHQIRRDLLPRISAFKFLISASNENYCDAPELGQSKYKIPVYLQPMDEIDKKKNNKNYALTLELARKLGYRISLQTHKFWGIE